MDIDRKALRPWLDQLREILNREWDPLGVFENSGGDIEDEYDTYRDRIASMMVGGATDTELIAYLQYSERETMGLGKSRDVDREIAHLQRVVTLIRALGPPPSSQEVQWVTRPRMLTKSYLCPCCRFQTLYERGGDDICPVCFWHDDGQDEADADRVLGGPNRHLSLRQAQINFREFGASDRRRLAFVRSPTPDEIPPSS
jgi:hypothetical protein